MRRRDPKLGKLIRTSSVYPVLIRARAGSFREVPTAVLTPKGAWRFGTSRDLHAGCTPRRPRPRT